MSHFYQWWPKLLEDFASEVSVLAVHVAISSCCSCGYDGCEHCTQPSNQEASEPHLILVTPPQCHSQIQHIEHSMANTENVAWQHKYQCGVTLLEMQQHENFSCHLVVKRCFWLTSRVVVQPWWWLGGGEQSHDSQSAFHVLYDENCFLSL